MLETPNRSHRTLTYKEGYLSPWEDKGPPSQGIWHKTRLVRTGWELQDWRPKDHHLVRPERISYCSSLPVSYWSMIKKGIVLLLILLWTIKRIIPRLVCLYLRLLSLSFLEILSIRLSWFMYRVTCVNGTPFPKYICYQLSVCETVHHPS